MVRIRQIHCPCNFLLTIADLKVDHRTGADAIPVTMSQRATQSDILKQISHRSRQLIQTLNAVLPPSCQPITNCTVEIETSRAPLPYPSSIASLLLKDGLAPTFVDSISSAYLRNALTLRHDYEQHIQGIYRLLVGASVSGQDISTQLSSTYTFFRTHYRQSLSEMIERTLALVRSRVLTTLAKGEKRTTFNKVCPQSSCLVYFLSVNSS